MRGWLRLVIVLIVFPHLVWGQPLRNTGANIITITTPTNVAWWAGIVEDGFKMPLVDGYQIDVWGDNHQNQIQPLLLSDQGDVIWSEEPFKIQFHEGESLKIDPKIGQTYQDKAGNSLRDAFLFASKKYFPPSGPDG